MGRLGESIMNKVIIDKVKLDALPKVVLDGQNIAFGHGETQAIQLNKKKVFSYEGFRFAFEALYKRGFKAEFILPSFHLSKKRVERFDKTKVIDYLNEFDVFVNVGGSESNKKDDSFILQHAFNKNLIIISNDQYRNKLEELSEKEYNLWKPWLDKNRLGFKFENDSFIIDSDCLSLKYNTVETSILEKSEVLIKKDKAIISKPKEIIKPVRKPHNPYSNLKNIFSIAAKKLRQ